MISGRRYVVLGAGGVGCALGGLLQAAGAEVIFIARGAQLDALAMGGLALALPGREIHLVVEAVPGPRAIRFEERDVVLLCTKSQDTEGALRDLAGHARDVPIVCAQNGVANEPMAARSFARVYGLVVFAPIQFTSPGRVSIHGEPVPGGLDVGLHPEEVDDLVTEVVGDLSLAGFDAHAQPRIRRWKYGKLLTNLGNALQALGGDAALDAGILAALRDEAIACLRAAGIDFAPGEELDARYGGIGAAPVDGAQRGGGSTWQSLARGTGSIETDYLNGEIVRLGERHGIATPYNRTLAVLAQRAAAERWLPGRLTLSEIEAAIRGG
ncbi:MAG: 2-dehydropantoate 2-reductase N-terminal domain-containing protein [Minicystis sp.]